MAYQKEERVLADWLEDNYYYPAIITDIRNHNKEFYLKFFKGDRHWINKAKIHPYDLEEGEIVKFRMRGTTDFDYRGKVQAIEEDNITVLLEGSEQPITIGIEDFCVNR